MLTRPIPFGHRDFSLDTNTWKTLKKWAHYAVMMPSA